MERLRAALRSETYQAVAGQQWPWDSLAGIGDNSPSRDFSAGE